jgi:hypothetical protein
MKKRKKKLALAKETVGTMQDVTVDGAFPGVTAPCCSVIGNPANSDCCTSVGSECMV